MNLLTKYLEKIKTVKSVKRTDSDAGMKDLGYMKYKIKDGIFYFYSSDEKVILPEYPNSMFMQAVNLTDITDLKYFETKKVKSFDHFFAGCESLKSLKGLEDWDVSSLRSARNMFARTAVSDLRELRNWKTEKLTDMHNMFYGSDIRNISALSDWDVSGVTDMSGLFDQCMDLEDISALTGWDVSSVSVMAFMFSGTGITNLKPIRFWNIRNVQDMANMFDGNEKLSSLEGLENWDMTVWRNMDQIFAGCTSLSVDLSKPWKKMCLSTF